MRPCLVWFASWMSLAPGSVHAESPAAFRIEPIDEAREARMRGVSWKPGCPVALADLALVRVRHWTEGDGEHAGELVVARRVAPAVLELFRTLHARRFPIASVKPIEAFGGDDDASMAANNTSAFNCRKKSRRAEYSRHSWGEAIDLNPLWNPYVQGDRVSPPAGRAFLARSPAPGVLVAGDPVVTLFAKAGWKWGGRWPKNKDYQHFSTDGR